MIFHALDMSERNWLPGGWAGVDVFFVLSGFLITANLRREMDATGRVRLRSFYMRRFLRLTPAFWTMAAAVLVLKALIGPGDPDAARSPIFALAYLMNWARAFAIDDGREFGHTWSLATEEQFYLLWPMMFVALSARARIPALVMAILAVTVWRMMLCWLGADPERTYNGLDTHMDGLLIGCVAALVPGGRWDRISARSNLIPLALLGVVFCTMSHRTSFAQCIGFTAVSLLSAWLIAACGDSNIASRCLSSPPSIFIGRISYGLYLWHYPVFVLLKPKIAHFAVPTLMAVSFACACMSYYIVEKPFLRLKSRYEPGRNRTDNMPDIAAELVDRRWTLP